MTNIKTLLSPKTIHQLMRYLVTGFTAFGIEYSLYVLLYKAVGLNYILASVIVYALVFLFSFFVNRKWSFQSQGRVNRQLFLYLLLFLFNLVFANVFLLRFLTDVLGINALFSPFLKMACVVCWNFFIYKFIIYKE